MNYTYLLQCADGSLYCGWTNHLQKRVKAHNEGHGAKYTRGRRPVKLVYFEEYATRQEAMRREYAIKRLTRQEKERLVESKETSGSLPESREQSSMMGRNGEDNVKQAVKAIKAGCE